MKNNKNNYQMKDWIFDAIKIVDTSNIWFEINNQIMFVIKPDVIIIVMKIMFVEFWLWI